MIDLHIHSTFSDGSLTPEQLVDKGRDIGLTAMALTDHDSTGGIDRFMTACEVRGQRSEVRGQQENTAGLIGIPGVEISANVKHGTLHMLGYLIDHRDGDLENVLKRIREGRNVRNEEMLDRLKKLGLKLSREEVAAFAGDDVVGRPHFAQALVARGWVATTEAAFELYLAKGKPGYVDRLRLAPADSISVICKAGGLPVLAHPFTLELDGRALKKYVGELVDMGLQGIEAYYSEYSRERQQECLRLAEEFKLAVSGGSDFHGKLNPKIELGTGFGSLRVPDGLVEELFQRVGSGIRATPFNPL